ncbi:MAG: PRC-barrel domain-containing protein [Phycisphaerae bacterium]|jgi:sporulation protein YlmC with PRC-barrel domain
MHRVNSIRVTALALVTICGCAMSAAQTQNNPSRDRPGQSSRDAAEDRAQDTRGEKQARKQENSQRAAMKLCYFKDLRGMNVTRSDGSTAFEIKDVVFDRHSGDIAGYVVSNDRVIAPSEVTATTDEKGAVQLRTTLTDDSLKGRLEFDDDAFDTKASKSDTVMAWWNRFASESKKQIRSDMDMYEPEKLKSTERSEVSGTIDSLDRVRGEGSIYRTIATIRAEDGSTSVVVLGPTWYLADEKALPMRGQRVTAMVSPLEGDEERWVASSISLNGGKMVTLREGDALNPVWYKHGKADSAVAVQRRMLLASSLLGDDVKCREESSGEVQNLVIDTAEHRVVAIVVDPNENFMGAADTLRLIPVSVASPSGDDLVFVDAEKDMIINAPAAPGNLSALNNAWKLDMMFKQRPIVSR